MERKDINIMSETKHERDFSVWRYLESSGEVFCLACGSYGDDEEPPFCPYCGRRMINSPHQPKE